MLVLDCAPVPAIMCHYHEKITAFFLALGKHVLKLQY